MKVGDRVKIISVPDCCKEELGKYATVKSLPNSFYGDMDILIDGDDGLTAIFPHQLEIITTNT